MIRRLRDNAPDVFDTTTTGGVGYWEWLLKGEDLDYYKNKMNLVGKIVYMTPREYYNECVPILNKMHQSNNNTFNSIVKSRNLDLKYIKELQEVITKKHEKFPICVLDISDNPGQEGLHRMLAIANLYGWDEYKFPVFLIQNYRKIYPKAELEKIVNEAKTHKFKDWNEAISYLDDVLITSIFHKNFDVNFTNDYSQIEVLGTYNDKDYIAYEDVNKFNVETPLDEENEDVGNEELSEKDLDEIDDLISEDDEDDYVFSDLDI